MADRVLSADHNSRQRHQMAIEGLEPDLSAQREGWRSWEDEIAMG